MKQIDELCTSFESGSVAALSTDRCCGCGVGGRVSGSDNAVAQPGSQGHVEFHCAGVKEC